MPSATVTPSGASFVAANVANSAYGVLAQTFERKLSSGTLIPASGAMRAGMIELQAGVTIGHLAVDVAVVGSGLTHGWLLLFDNSLALVAQTADQGAGTFTATGLISVALTATYTPATSIAAYAAYLGVQSAGACPSLAVNNGTGINFILDAIGAGQRAGFQQTGLAAPPNPAVPVTAGILPWVAALA